MNSSGLSIQQLREEVSPEMEELSKKLKTYYRVLVEIDIPVRNQSNDSRPSVSILHVEIDRNECFFRTHAEAEQYSTTQFRGRITISQCDISTILPTKNP